MELIRRVPNEIRLRILSYTYRPQPPFLLRDIENYKETKDKLLVVYHDYWNSEHRDWLLNDIFSYANHYKASMYGYVDHFYSIFMRKPKLLTKGLIDRYVENLGEKDVKTQINIVLGLFTVYERTDLVIDLSLHLEE